MAMCRACCITFQTLACIHSFQFCERCGSVVVSTHAYHAAGRGSIPVRTGRDYYVKTGLSTVETVYINLCLSEEILEAVGPFYLVYLPGEVKDPTQGVNV